MSHRGLPEQPGARALHRVTTTHLLEVVLWAGVRPHVRPRHRQLFQLHVEDVEDEAVQGRAQTVAQPPDPRYHPLHDTCEAGRKGRSVRRRAVPPWKPL